MSPIHAEFKIFISAVSGELASWREEVARVLRRKGLTVRDQNHFRQGSATLLEQLRDYIEECDAVIFLIGRQSGEFPSTTHAASVIPNEWYAQFASTYGHVECSYTQWEFFLSKQLSKPRYVFMTQVSFSQDSQSAIEVGQKVQADFRDFVSSLGESGDHLSSKERLVEDVLVLPFPSLKSEPFRLPYPTLGPLFLGRETVLEKLDLSLKRASEQCTSIISYVIHGLGGVGKTRLAVEYGWRQREHYSAVLFVSVQTPTDFERSFAGLVDPDGLDLPQQHMESEAARQVAVRNWLNANPGWLLILDGVDNEESASAIEHLLCQLVGGSVLITGRLDRWGGTFECHELDSLDSCDALEFLLRRTQNRRDTSETDTDDARRLANDLGGLALGLEQAGAYIEHRRISIAEYRELWNAQVDYVRGWYDERLMKYPRSIATTWQTTFDQLSSGEVALLQLLSLFSPSPVPLSIFEPDEAKDIWASCLRAGNLNHANHCESEALDALVNLSNYSMLQWQTTEQTVTVHPIVQEVLRSRLCLSWRDDLIATAMELLALAGTGDTNSTVLRRAMTTIRAHSLSVLSFAGDEADYGAVSLMSLVGVSFRYDGRFNDALTWQNHCLAVANKVSGLSNADRCGLHVNVAETLMEIEKNDEAEDHLRQAKAILETTTDIPQEVRLIIESDLAYVLFRQGAMAEAEQLMKDTLEATVAIHGESSPDVGIRASNLANLLSEVGRHEEAEALYLRSIKIFEANYDGTSPRLATALSNLSVLMLQLERNAEAEVPIRRAIQVEIDNFGDGCFQVGLHRLNLVDILIGQERLDEASETLAVAAPVIEEALGQESVQFARVLQLGGIIENKMGRFDVARSILQDSYELCRKVHGPDDLETIATATILADVMFDCGDENDGLSLLCSLVERRIKLDSANPTEPTDELKLISNCYAGMLHRTGKSPDQIVHLLQSLGLFCNVVDKQTGTGVLIQGRFTGDREPLTESTQKKRRFPGRNDPCPCGSGLKYKKCCLRTERDSVH